MPECSECGEQVSMPFTCKFCEETFCSEHRLPENHDCAGLEKYQEESRREGKVAYDAMKEEREASEVEVSGGSTRSIRAAIPGGIRSFLPGDATTTVLGAIAVVFLLQISYGLQASIVDFGLDPTLVVAEPWRLVTSIFMHGGLAHLMINGIVLWSFGRHIERLMGTDRFLTVLFAAAIASSLGFAVSGYFFGIGPAVGISGGLYGMVAFLAVVRPQVTVLAFFFIPLRIRQAVMFFGALDLVNFFAHAAGYYLPLIGGFASAGHLSGLVTGLVFGYLWQDDLRTRGPQVLIDFSRSGRPPTPGSRL